MAWLIRHREVIHVVPRLLQIGRLEALINLILEQMFVLIKRDEEVADHFDSITAPHQVRLHRCKFSIQYNQRWLNWAAIVTTRRIRSSRDNQLTHLLFNALGEQLFVTSHTPLFLLSFPIQLAWVYSQPSSTLSVVFSTSLPVLLGMYQR